MDKSFAETAKERDLGLAPLVFADQNVQRVAPQGSRVATAYTTVGVIA